LWAGKMPSGQENLAVLTEDPGLIPSAHIQMVTTICNSCPGTPTPSPSSHRHYMQVEYIHIHMQANTHTHEIKINKSKTRGREYFLQLGTVAHI